MFTLSTFRFESLTNSRADIGHPAVANATTILFCISSILVIAVYIIYWKGPELRKRSPFAQQLSQAREDTDGRRLSYVPSAGARRASRAFSTASSPERARRSSRAASRADQTRRISQTMGSRRASQVSTDQ